MSLPFVLSAKVCPQLAQPFNLFLFVRHFRVLPYLEYLHCEPSWVLIAIFIKVNWLLAAYLVRLHRGTLMDIMVGFERRVLPVFGTAFQKIVKTNGIYFTVMNGHDSFYLFLNHNTGCHMLKVKYILIEMDSIWKNVYYPTCWWFLITHSIGFYRTRHWQKIQSGYQYQNREQDEEKAIIETWSWLE